MDPIAHRESARTTDPDTLADKVARIRQNLDHNRRARYARLTTPLRAAEQFAATEAANEHEQDRHA